MKTAGIVAEFNPFHNGHKYLIDKAREMGAECIVSVMSGNFVQRGEPAIFETDVRVDAALKNGVDLVIQLPVASAISGAKGFAKDSVSILNALGTVDTLVFGSESGDIEELEATASALSDPDFEEKMLNYLCTGITYAAAREKALADINPAFAKVIREPNNILAIEYINAIRELGSSMTPVTIQRKGVSHDSDSACENFASASKIREMIRAGEDVSAFIPDCCKELYTDNFVSYDKFETAVLCIMRMMDSETISDSPDISEGIENRIYSAVSESKSLGELYSLAKTKRYTHARIRRIVLNSVLGITKEDVNDGVRYIRILGMTLRGAEIIKISKKVTTMPVVSKTADFKALFPSAQRAFDNECRASAFFTSCLSEPLSADIEKDRKVKIYR